MRYYILALVSCLFVCCASLPYSGYAAERAMSREEVTPAVADMLLALTRETVLATREQRGPKYAAAALRDLSTFNNGVQILLMKKGRVLGSAQAYQSTLLGNIRQAAALAVNQAKGAQAKDYDIVIALYLPGFPASEVSSALPMYPAAIGAEAYRATFSGKTHVTPPFHVVTTKATAAAGASTPTDPHIARQDWKQVLCEMVRDITGNAPDTAPGVLLKISMDSDFQVEVLPTVTIAGGAHAKHADILYRLHSLVPVQDVEKERIDAALNLALGWYLENQQADGNFPVLYDPVLDQSLPEESLLTRLWNVVAIARLWKYTNRMEARALGLTALDRIFKEHYLEDPSNGIGYLREGESVRMAPIAMALVAIEQLESGKDGEKFAAQAKALRAAMQGLRLPDGRWRTYLIPAEKTGHEQTDPGMAQYAMILDAMATSNGEQAEQCFQSYRFYAEVFKNAQQKRNPPYHFVPWHSLAVRQIYTATKRQELVNFLIDMNEWAILATQQIYHDKQKLPPDVRGRFYVDTGHNTPVRSAETGLFLLGATQAYRLSRDITSETNAMAVERNGRLRTRILWGARYLLQMQITSDADLIQMRNPTKARGAFSINTEDARISLESTAFAVWALCEIAQTLQADDYAEAARLK